MQWFRMYSEAVDDDKLRLLAFEDRWHFVAILCCKCAGILDSNDADLKRRRVQVKLGLGDHDFSKVVARLADVDLIDPDTLEPKHWNARQRVSDADSTNAERQRRYRAAHANGVRDSNALRNVTRNGAVTRPEAEAERSKAPEPANAGSESIADAMDAPPLPESSPETAPTQGDDNAHSGVPRNPPCPVEQIVALYHAKLPMCRRVEQLTPNRRASLRARWRNELPTLDAFGNYFDDVAASRFLTGRVNGHGDRKPFVADFDWLLKPSNFVKVLEGKYHDGQ